tara:strand:- start:2567 stop:5719 length:3153 start_codon:yes stop_codon:yes gene_type:complete
MIEKIIEIIDIEVKNLKKKGEVIKEEFYSDGLKEIAKNYILMLSQFHEKFKLELDKFDDRYNVAVKQHRAKTPITIERSRTIRKKSPQWLTKQRQESIGWENDSKVTYRGRYFKYLKKVGRSKDIILETERSTLNIVKNLGDPNSRKAFYKKGMVVGSVQSGKTANFNGVINTAIDAGYKMVIVLSGLMEDLRVQTQKRIELDVVGPKKGGVGVGVGKGYPITDNYVNTITSIESDFSRNLLEADFDKYSTTKILICKKNVSILRNILLWLNESISEEHPLIDDLPLLIIDDEADNASLNNLGYKGVEFATRTNKEIRSILALFSKKSYLGYTATPFANVLQDRNEILDTKNIFTHKKENYNFEMVPNLFPDDFIELLTPPSNYVGIKNFFETRIEKRNQNGEIENLKIENIVADAIDIDDPNYYLKIPPRFNKETGLPTTFKGKGTRSANLRDNYPSRQDGLPKSLKEAIQCFILSIAIRLSRESELKETPFYHKHHTMLIHISLFAVWQDRLKILVEDYVKKITENLNNDGLDAPVWSEFERVWIKHYSYIVNNIKNHLNSGYNDPYLTPQDFHKDIKILLTEAVKNIEIPSVNSKSGESLDYGKEPKKYIAIGGNRLSRGFTLEGLTVNYFLRKANTIDTLMQMGRWFGYRPGYIDCCKLFTTSDNIEKFNQASITMEDLEEKFAYLAGLDDRTPRDYTLWIQNNPDVIKLTRTNFLKGLTFKNLDFSDTVQQSTQFKIDKEMIEKSITSFKKHVSTRIWDEIKNKKGAVEFLKYDTNQKGLKEFLELPNTMLNLDTNGLYEYLEECEKKNKLVSWTIALKVINEKERDTFCFTSNGTNYNIPMIKRSGPTIGSDENRPSRNFNSLINNDIFKARNSTIISPSDFSVTLKPEVKNKAEIDFKSRKGNSKKSVPDSAYREKMDESKGLLVVYLMDINNILHIDGDGQSETNKQLDEYKNKKNLNNLKGVPIIGCALGFPKITGITGGKYITQHDFPEINKMTLEQLKEFVVVQDYDIDLEETEWTRKELFTEIEDIDKELEDELNRDE